MGGGGQGEFWGDNQTILNVTDSRHRREARGRERGQTEEDNYCRQVLEEQMAKGWAGVTKEVKYICKMVGLQDACISYVRRKGVREAV